MSFPGVLTRQINFGSLFDLGDLFSFEIFSDFIFSAVDDDFGFSDIPLLPVGFSGDFLDDFLAGDLETPFFLDLSNVLNNLFAFFFLGTLGVASVNSVTLGDFMPFSFSAASLHLFSLCLFSLRLLGCLDSSRSDNLLIVVTFGSCLISGFSSRYRASSTFDLNLLPIGLIK